MGVTGQDVVFVWVEVTSLHQLNRKVFCGPLEYAPPVRGSKGKKALAKLEFISFPHL